MATIMDLPDEHDVKGLILHHLYHSYLLRNGCINIELRRLQSLHYDMQCLFGLYSKGYRRDLSFSFRNGNISKFSVPRSRHACRLTVTSSRAAAGSRRPPSRRRAARAVRYIRIWKGNLRSTIGGYLPETVPRPRLLHTSRGSRPLLSLVSCCQRGTRPLQPPRSRLVPWRSQLHIPAAQFVQRLRGGA